MTTPDLAQEDALAHETVTLSTADGPCATAVFTPAAGGAPWPAAVFLMDGGGPRPALHAMAQRLADLGYLVALPDLFHRAQPYEWQTVMAMALGAQTRTQWRERFYEPATRPENFRTDFAAVLAHLAERPDVLQPHVGTTGYCMGGNLSLRAAGEFPERVTAAASFHGGFLASDAPDSPHRLAPRMKARIYVAGAIEDPSFTDEMKERLVQALTDAKVEHVCETYAARHGFAIPDFPTYDAAAAERHWQALAAFYARALRAS